MSDKKVAGRLSDTSERFDVRCAWCGAKLGTISVAALMRRIAVYIGIGSVALSQTVVDNATTQLELICAECLLEHRARAARTKWEHYVEE